MIKQRFTLDIAGAQVSYTLFQRSPLDKSFSSSSAGKKSRLMLLHGAGVAGELTWTYIVNYLKSWDEILVPDLLGMGDSYFDVDDAREFTIEDICNTLFSVLRHLQWVDFDLAGYSLGGLVALELNHESLPDFKIDHLCLIEPALFNDESLQNALVFRRAFTPIAANIKSDVNNPQHFIDFLDLVSPKRMRNEKVDLLAVRRLQRRPHGFANALAAVSQYAEKLDEHKLHSLMKCIPQGIGIVGGLSDSGLLHAQEKIKQVQPQWYVEMIPEVDHSLVYVRPKVIAHLFNQYLIST
jgi:pimeloyl-ACP methyl ester carboxylesterase